MASASPPERARVAGIDWIETAIEGVRAKIPPARGVASQGARGIFDLTPIVQRWEKLGRTDSQSWEAWGQSSCRRALPVASSGTDSCPVPLEESKASRCLLRRRPGVAQSRPLIRETQYSITLIRLRFAV